MPQMLLNTTSEEVGGVSSAKMTTNSRDQPSAEHLRIFLAMNVSRGFNILSAVNSFKLDVLVGLVTGGETGIGLTIAQVVIRNGTC